MSTATKSKRSSPASRTTATANVPPDNPTINIELSRVVPHPDNPRSALTGIEDLAASMKERGQLVEALGRYLGPAMGEDETDPIRVQLIAGHRRLEAAKLAGLKTLRVRILGASHPEAIEIMGRDNEERENFDGIARGRWYQSMLDAFELTQRGLAEKLNKSQGEIAKYLRLLQLPEVWQSLLIDGTIDTTKANEVAKYLDRPDVMQSALDMLTLRRNEEWTSRAWAEALEHFANGNHLAPVDDDADAGGTASLTNEPQSQSPKQPADKGRSKAVQDYRHNWLLSQVSTVIAERADGLSERTLETILREMDFTIEKNWVPDREFLETQKKGELVALLRADWAEFYSEELQAAAAKMTRDEIIEDILSAEIRVTTWPLPACLR